MRHLIIKIAIFIVFLTLGTRSYCQLTQTYKNGWVAATDRGVYYLQDGENQWVNWGGSTDYDTITGISFYKDRLYVSEWTKKIVNTQYYSKLYGLKSSSVSANNGAGGYSRKYDKSISSKLKWNDSRISLFYIGSRIFIEYASNYFNYFYYPIGSSDYTSMSTDNDSTLVYCGKNNLCEKAGLSSNNTLNTYNDVSGLSSTSTAGHQICYNKNDDLFYIVSDKGKLYSYNKSTVTFLKTLPLSYMDSAIDLEYDPYNDLLALSYRVNASGYHYNLELFKATGDVYFNYSLSAPAQMKMDELGSLMYIRDTVATIRDMNTYNITDVTYLPYGTKVYDVDYINYLPYVAPIIVDTLGWTYSGTLTVGYYSDWQKEMWGYYGYDLMGSIIPTPNFYEFSYGIYDGSPLPPEIEISFNNSINNLDSISINGITYSGFYKSYYNTWAIGTNNGNPFPPVGQSCTIKLKYYF